MQEGFDGDFYTVEEAKRRKVGHESVIEKGKGQSILDPAGDAYQRGGG